MMAIFVRLRIIILNKHLGLPLASKINEGSGVRDFTNDMDNQIIYIDKASFEYLKEYHDARFEVIDGGYDNDGRNHEINSVIKDCDSSIPKLKRTSQHRLLLNYS